MERQHFLLGNFGYAARQAALAAILCSSVLLLPRVAHAQSGNVPCGGGSGTTVLFENDTSVTSNFVLSLTGNPAGNPGLPLTGFTLSWKAPSGTKSASINGQISEDFAISLAAGGTITYSCSELSNISWTVSSSAGKGNLACDQGSFSATGALVENAQTNALNLSFGLSGNQPDGKAPTINLSWTDSSGKPHAAALTNEFSKGFGISLGAGQLLKFSCSAAETGNWSF